jgi:hypothetical protein
VGDQEEAQMAENGLPHKSPFEQLKYVFLLLFRPHKFEVAETFHDHAIGTTGEKGKGQEPHVTATAVRRIYLESLIIIFFASAVGLGAGFLYFGNLGDPAFFGKLFLVTGAGLILWSILALLGWEVQDHSGTGLAERTNKWLFRYLFGIGTMLLMAGIGAIR